eukprot:166110-Pleurochrysis_carterae.AAC.1
MSVAASKAPLLHMASKARPFLASEARPAPTTSKARPPMAGEARPVWASKARPHHTASEARPYTASDARHIYYPPIAFYPSTVEMHSFS